MLCGIMALGVGLTFVDELSNDAVAPTATVNSNGYINVGDILFSNYSNLTKKFNGYALDLLYQQITGISNANFSDVSSLAPTGNSTNWKTNVFNAANIRAKNKSINKTAYGNDIQLTFGGQNWTVTELFKDSRGNVCLALLLKDSTTSTYAWNSYNNTSFSSNSINANVYGASTMRSVVLNNGGKYATSNTDISLSKTATQSTSNAWAKFTMSTSQISTSVRDYLVTPYYTYQKNDTVIPSLLSGWNTQNQFFNTTCELPSNYTYFSVITSNGYINNTAYQNWKNDYIWLPSVQELGRAETSLSGRWGLSTSQVTTSKSYWTRTSGNMFNNELSLFSNVRIMSTLGEAATEYAVTTKQAIRPCVFLNLTAAEANKATSIVTPSNVSASYTGSDLTSKFTSASWYNSSKMTISYDKTKYDYTTVGSHVATVTCKAGYYFGTNPNSTSVNVTLTISKAAITAPVNTSYVYDGNPHKFESETWYSKISSFVTITPDESDYNYTDVRLYSATVTLTNSNYYFSGLSTSATSTKVSISITKKVIQKPSVINMIWDGQSHSFETRTWWDSYQNILDSTKPIEYIVGEEGGCRDVGTYSAKLFLPNDNYRWSDVDSRETIITSIINPKVISPSDITLEYDGNPHKESEVTSQTWFDSTNLSVVYGEGDFTDAGTYNVRLVSENHPNVVFSGNKEQNSWNITLNISKKKVNVQHFEINPDTALPTSEPKLSSEPYDRDTVENGKAPILGVQYSADNVNWTDVVPDHSGKYYYRAYITNAETCNYELVSNGGGTFTKAKGPVYMPRFVNYLGINEDNSVNWNVEGLELIETIYGWTTKVKYTGENQVFILMKRDDTSPLTSNVQLGDKKGGFVAHEPKIGENNEILDTFTVKDVGVYTIDLTPRDPANMQWNNWDKNTAPNRTITLEVVKSKIEYEIVDDSQTSWEVGSIATIEIKFVGEGVDFSSMATRPKISVLAGIAGGTLEPVGEEKYNYTENQLIVSVDISNYQANTHYEISIVFDNSGANALINKNYYLVSTGNTPTDERYSFFLTTAVVDSLDVEWLYSNPGISTGLVFDASTELIYNEYEYHFKLNETLLPTGVNVAYENDVKTDAKTYKTTATLTLGNGTKFNTSINSTSGIVTVKYVSDSVATVEVNWEIKPTTFDLATLGWAEDLTFNTQLQHMTLESCPSWITVAAAPGGTNQAILVGEYTAKFKLTPDINHIFVGDADWIEILDGGTSAIVSHVWHITKIIITVSDREVDWTYLEAEDVNFNLYEYAVPNAYSNYKDQLVITYYTDDDFAEEHKIDDILNITITPGNVTWIYAKVELSSDENVQKLYDIKNAYNENKYATLAFTVGDNRSLLQVDLNFTEAGTTYNGQEQALVATCPDLFLGQDAFKVTYYTQDEDGNFSVQMDDGWVPVNAGTYLALISFSDDFADFDSSYNISNKRFEFVIHKLQLVVESWTDKEGLVPPEEKVVSANETDFDLSTAYTSRIVDANGNEVTGLLEYNKQYKKILTPANANIEFVEGSEVEHEFRTGLNPAGDYVPLKKPEFVAPSLVWNNQDQTFEIEDWENLSQYLEIVEGESYLTQKEVAQYTITLRFKPNANATWDDEDKSNNDVILHFEITKMMIIKPEYEVGTPLQLEFNADGKYWPNFPEGFNYDFVVVEGNQLETLGLGSGTMTVKLLNKDNMVWDDETTEDLVIDYIVVARGLEIPVVSQLENKADFIYSGELIEFNPERDLTHFNADYMEIVESVSVLSGTNANTYKITISLKFKQFTYWKDVVQNPDVPEIPEETPEGGEEGEISATAIGDTADVEVEWQIFKAPIVGEWKEENNVPVFVPSDETQKDLFDVKYFAVDENGEYKLDEFGNKIEVKPEEMVEGENYKAEIVLKDENNYETSGIDEVEIENEKEFEYKKNRSFFEEAWEFIKAHWIWFVIGLGVLLLLILLVIIIVAVRRKKRKQEELAEQEALEEENSEEETQSEENNEESNEEEKVEETEEKTEQSSETRNLQETEAQSAGTSGTNVAGGAEGSAGNGSGVGGMNGAVGGNGGTYIFMNGQPIYGNAQSQQAPEQVQPQNIGEQQAQQQASTMHSQQTYHTEQTEPRYGEWVPTQDAKVSNSSDVEKLLEMLLEAYQTQEMKVRDDMQNLDFRQGELHDFGVQELRKHEMDLMEQYRKEERRLEELKEQRRRMEKREERRREEQRQEMLREERRREERRQDELRDERRREERRQEQLREERMYEERRQEERLREERRQDEKRQEQLWDERRREERKQDEEREDRRKKMNEKKLEQLKNKKKGEEK